MTFMVIYFSFSELVPLVLILKAVKINIDSVQEKLNNSASTDSITSFVNTDLTTQTYQGRQGEQFSFSQMKQS